MSSASFAVSWCRCIRRAIRRRRSSGRSRVQAAWPPLLFLSHKNTPTGAARRSAEQAVTQRPRRSEKQAAGAHQERDRQTRASPGTQAGRRADSAAVTISRGNSPGRGCIRGHGALPGRMYGTAVLCYTGFGLRLAVPVNLDDFLDRALSGPALGRLPPVVKENAPGVGQEGRFPKPYWTGRSPSRAIPPAPAPSSISRNRGISQSSAAGCSSARTYSFPARWISSLPRRRGRCGSRPQAAHR